MARRPRPHVSEALRGLRGAVLACALVAGAAVAAQMLVWAFVHFTDIRTSVVEADPSAHPPQVVRSAPRPDAARPAPAVDTKSEQSASGAVDPNVVRSKHDIWLRSVSDVARLLGVIAILALNVLIFQAVVIAGGGAIPGVQKAVQAGAWAMVVALLTLPWRAILGDFPIPGALQGYEALTAASEAQRAGASELSGAGYFGVSFILPLVVLVGLALVALRFNAGVEAGVIVTSVSELDEALEREMASMKLASARTPKAVGALNRAIGDRDSDDEPAPSRSGNNRKVKAAPDDEEEFRRPI